jgi:hypothetical protein
MRITVLGSMALATLLGTARPARAQTHVSGYAVGGPGGVSAFFRTQTPMLSAAGGAEVMTPVGLGAGAELGLLANSGGFLRLVSVNGVMRLSPRNDSSAVPFLTAGYTNAASSEAGFNAWNIGGGILLRSAHRPGVRIEFRDHVRPDIRGTCHYWSLRAGISF